MLIDWFTVGAQVLNFAVLVWLMRHFLFKPVREAIAAREAGIAASLAQADAVKSQAQTEKSAFEQRSEAFAHDRAGLFATATSEAAAERVRLIAAAREAADAVAAQRAVALAQQEKSLRQSLRQRTQHEVFAIARKTMAELANATLEASCCDVFDTQLRALRGPARDALASALRTDNAARVRSAFELAQPQREILQKCVNETFSIAASLQFDTAPDLVSGIELTAHGCRFAWSISDRLDTFDRSVTELLAARSTTNGAPVQA
jgi:F-type H+-transporting ATPase subunit b